MDMLPSRDENGTDIFRPYSRPNSFRGVLIRPYLNIWYCIRIRIFKSHIYDVDIQSYSIRHFLYYPYSNPNPDINMKTNTISVISVRIRSVFIPTSKCIPASQSTDVHALISLTYLSSSNAVFNFIIVLPSNGPTYCKRIPTVPK
jgi:hypothetical protein